MDRIGWFVKDLARTENLLQLAVHCEAKSTVHHITQHKAEMTMRYGLLARLKNNLYEAGFQASEGTGERSSAVQIS